MLRVRNWLTLAWNPSSSSSSSSSLSSSLLLLKPRFLTGGGQKDDEQKLTELLRQRFPEAVKVEVVDVSGGCGAMYEVYVSAPDFKGLRLVKQHQLVQEALKTQIANMHGIRISTSAS